MPSHVPGAVDPAFAFHTGYYCALAAGSEVLLDGSDFYDCVCVRLGLVLTIGVKCVVSPWLVISRRR